MDEKLKAAYALNLCTVSVAQIVDYNDINVLEQEYENILNNLNLEQMPKDEALLNVLMKILDAITYFRISEGDKKMVDAEYQHKMKNAVWASVPNVGAIFATSNPVAIGITLATQVGIGYMNYRRNKADYQLGREKEYWQLRRGAIDQLNGLQKELFATAWNLAEEYSFQDEYRLTESQIKEYNETLMEKNPVSRWKLLKNMEGHFIAYPHFWYQLGSAANCVYRSEMYAEDPEMRAIYKIRAVDAFERYQKLNAINVLRSDVLTSACALEYLELLDLTLDDDKNKAKELIETAEKYSGNAFDVLELCAFAYLRINDSKNAARLLDQLVNKGYNSGLNAQILSALYIKMMYGDDRELASDARTAYKELQAVADPKCVLSLPDQTTDLSNWKPNWNKDETIDEMLEREKAEQQRTKENVEDQRRKAMAFYQTPIKLVYTKETEKVSELFLALLNENRSKLNSNSPSPSRCTLKDYEKAQTEIEESGAHVILLGDSTTAKKFYKSVKNARWDYYHLGMRYVSFGSKTVILTRKLKNDQIDDLVSLGKALNEKITINVPKAAGSVSYMFSPLDVLWGRTWALKAMAEENIANSVQFFRNLKSSRELETLQYAIAIYKYLESEKALVE